VLLDQSLSFRKSLRFEAIVRVQLDRGFDPEFGLALGMLHMHMRARFLARKEVEAKPLDAQNRRTLRKE
jgi:hypothetical protein